MLKKRLQWIYPMADSSSTSNKVESCNKIMNDSVFEIGSFKDVFVDIDHSWETEEDSRILRRELHTHYFLEDFAHAYLVTQDEKYLNHSLYLLKNWIEKFPAYKFKDVESLAYHDEGTAIRLLFWLKYYYKVFDKLSSDDKNYLNENIVEQSKILTNNQFYSGVNNHGMFQDIAIIAYTIFDDDNFYENELFKTSLQRITQYFQEVFTSEGVHKEHAPSYHILVLHNLKHVILALRNADYKDDKVDFLESIYKKGEQYIINVTMPNFKLPKISDSTETDMTKTVRYRDLFDTEEYKYVTSGGKEGKETPGGIFAYPKSGYFIAKEGWKENSSYLLFLASYHMHYHKHTDDLSFILYKDRPIFIDSGPHNYNYKNELTQYGYSAFAHSTLVLNDKSLPRTDFKFNDVYIEKHSIEGNSFSVTGINKRFKDTVHKRTISGTLNEDIYELEDIIESNNRNQYKLLFQISGDLDLYKHNNIISIFSRNTKIGELELIESSGCDKVNISILSQQTYPNIMGYEFPKKESVKASKVVVIEAYNNNDLTRIKTEIRFNNFKLRGGATYKDKFEEVNHGDINYIYKDFKHKKLAVIFSGTENPLNYPTEHRFDELSQEYNLLIIKDNQFTIGSSFIKGKSNSSIESDIVEVIEKYINKENLRDDTIILGKSKGGFGALYYGLRLGINTYVISPLTKIGDYYSRYEKYKEVMYHLSGGNGMGDKIYLNSQLFKLRSAKKMKIVVGIGEKDYHFNKHINPLKTYLDSNNIDNNIEIYKGIEFKNTDEFIGDFLRKYLLSTV